MLRLLHAAKTRSRFLRDGRERPHGFLGGWKPPKVGSLPPFLVFCPRAVSLPSLYASAYFSSACRASPSKAAPKAEPKVGFTLSVTSRSPGSRFCLGLSLQIGPF